MLKIIKGISIEITRRCNQSCKHCMRGEPENLDMNKEYIDMLFKEDLIIMNLNLSGGEPTLKEDGIEYIIDKIIKERKIVLTLQMTTNGLIYSEKIINAFNRYYDYANKNSTLLYDCMELQGPVVEIRLSNDQYHMPIENYKNNLGNITLQYTGNLDFLDDGVLLTGRAKDFVFGRKYEYTLKKHVIRKYEKVVAFMDSFYLTATGFITNNGDGEYKDMDRINFGHIKDFSFENLINKEAQRLEKRLY